MATTISTEEKLRRVQRMLPRLVGTIIRAVVDRYGDEGRQLICDALYQQGQAQGQRAFAEVMKQTRR